MIPYNLRHRYILTMIHENSHTQPSMQTAAPEGMKLEDFGKLQERYQRLGLADRAQAVLIDAEPALQAADRILASLAATPKVRPVFDGIRKNHALTGKMRPSEAKNMLMDANSDFIETARHKLAAWRKTMERVSKGEGIVQENSREYIPNHMPVAVALASVCSASGYLAIIQLALGELGKADNRHATQYASDLARIRRCATLLSDCENASAISALVN